MTLETEHLIMQAIGTAISVVVLGIVIYLIRRERFRD